jgi:hypothetical protein
MSEDRLIQIVYKSLSADDVDGASILETSRHNNALDGVTGIL